MKYNTELAIIIPACDAYFDIVTEYLRYFKKNWNDCPFELILVSESKEYIDDRVTSVTTSGTENWAGRALKGIEKCNCPFILTMMEDHFISKPVNSRDIFDIISFMKFNNIQYYRNPKKSNKRTKENKFDCFQYACKIPKNRIYGRDFGIVVWKRETLVKILGDGSKSAWDIEKEFLEYAKLGHTGYFDQWVSDTRNFLHIIETISGGKWLLGSIRRFKKLRDPVNVGARPVHSAYDYYRRKLHGAMNVIVPPKMRKPLKKMIAKLGYKFATEE